MRYKLGFIGCGNMGGALIAAAAKTLKKGEIAVCDLDENKVRALEKSHGVVGVNLETLARDCDFVVFGVKPQALEKTIAPIAEILRAREKVVVVTMAAGVSIAGLRSFIGAKLPVVRIMPNTPAAVGEGMILYSLADANEETHDAFRRYFANAGKFHQIDESQIDAGSALSGCGPAFVYAFAEALIDGATECGVPKDAATLYAAQTLKGAAEMLLQFGEPVPLRQAVCSPNGTTIEGVHFLESSGFHESVKGAVKASYKRTLELKK